MERIVGRSVSSKLLVPILISVLILVTTLTIFWSSRYQNALRGGFVQQSEIIEAFSAQPLSAALYTFDTNLAEHTLNGLEYSSGTKYARVLSLNRDGQTEIFAEWTKADEETSDWTSLLERLASNETDQLQSDSWRLTRIPLSAEDIELGFLELAIDTSEIEFSVLQANQTALMIGGLSFLIIGTLIYFTARRITRPISELAQAVNQLGSGDLSIDIKPARREDELGTLGQSLEVFRENMIEQKNLHSLQKEAADAQAQAIKELAAGLHKMADRDFENQITGSFPEEYIQLRDDLNETVRVLSESFSTLRDSGETVSLNTNAIASAANDLAIRTERSAAELEAAARAIADLNAAVAQTVKSVDEVSALINETRNSSKSNQTVMNDAMAAMTEIEDRSNQIKSIVSLIDDIAFQTNLLALNAGVEAARAGDAGAGFAVVASEVRALAHRSSEAAGEITSVIRKSTKSVENGTILVTQAGETLSTMSNAIIGIMERVEEISTTAKGQSKRIEAMNSTVQHLDGDMQKNAAMFEETSATSEILSAEAKALHDELARFRVGKAPTQQDLDRNAA